VQEIEWDTDRFTTTAAKLGKNNGCAGEGIELHGWWWVSNGVATLGLGW